MIEEHARLRAARREIHDHQVERIHVRPFARRTQARDAPSIRRDARRKLRARAGRELLEERHLQIGEGADRGELEHFLVGVADDDFAELGPALRRDGRSKHRAGTHYLDRKSVV